MKSIRDLENISVSPQRVHSDREPSDKCFYYTQSRKQRAEELDRGQGLRGTEGYKISRCYDCDGFNFKCKMYLSNKEAEGGERK